MCQSHPYHRPLTKNVTESAALLHPALLTELTGGVGIGSNPPPGIRLVIVGAGAKRERALASSGILPEEQNGFVIKSKATFQILFFYLLFPFNLNIVKKKKLQQPLKKSKTTHVFLSPTPLGTVSEQNYNLITGFLL